ncbi:MAG: hypothetical protein CMJ21_03750 [Phycisphaerae bacterium]|nr:hypothetical protein [Phycisphaerae bacterium]
MERSVHGAVAHEGRRITGYTGGTMLRRRPGRSVVSLDGAYLVVRFDQADEGERWKQETARPGA